MPDSAMTHNRAFDASFPINGATTTLRTSDHIMLQLHYGYLNADRGRLKLRFGRSKDIVEPAGWSEFFDVSLTPTDAGIVTAEAGFALYSGRPLDVTSSGKIVTFDGAVTKDTPSVVTSGTVIATYSGVLSAGIDSAYGVATVWDGSVFEQVPISISASGVITIARTTTINAVRIYVSITYSAR